MQPLKIFTDKTYLPPGKPHFVLLFPFWGKVAEDPKDPSSGRYDLYTQKGSQFFTLTTLQECEFAVLPAAWEHYEHPEQRKLALAFSELTRQARKKMIVFYWHDSPAPVELPDSIVYRTSLYESKREPNEFAMPAWSEDFVEKYYNGEIPIRQKNEIATVGFCGAANQRPNRSLLRKMKDALKSAPADADSREQFLRREAIDILTSQNEVRTNFVIRDSFLGGAIEQGTFNADIAARVRKEYLKNMEQSDYTLCVRGAGNFSYRFYETLSLGRTPVFVNTDCVLPYPDKIDWKEHCIWVEQNSIEQLPELIASFHRNISADQFISLQLNCRKLWLEFLSPAGFFEHLPDTLRGTA